MRKLILPQPPKSKTTEDLYRYINQLHHELLRLNIDFGDMKGHTGSFTNGDGDTVVVKNGIITEIAPEEIL